MTTLRSVHFSHRGVALLTVLAIIVLITVLIVGFLLRASTERTATANYSATTAAQLMAENVVNLVQAQINDATTKPDAAWASQPGAIRVFNQTGGLDRIYRLYSATTFTATTASALQADIPPAGWAGQPANWVDLNAPVAVAGIMGTNGNELLSYPILDPRDPVDPSQIAILDGGFNLNNPPGATATQPAPMPVRWLYVLKKGAVVTPVGTGNTVTVPGASQDDPIVGRIAFWTDDETAKININTAADGSFWDVPRFGSVDDIEKFARNQPAAGEYQRYPGHPATTSLRPVMESLGLNIGAYPSGSGTPSELFKLLPRYNDDRGSKQGTVIPSATPSPKNERLYSSVGEMLYDPARADTALDRQQLETAKFFLTTQSRAPELTLFGTPRMSIWPVDQSITSNSASPRTTAFDRLAAFASTLGASRQYFFQRANADSPTADYANISRNQELYSYLQGLTSREVPGFGGSFASKYGPDRNQILTQIFDYIRLTSLYDATLDPVGFTGNSKLQFTDKGTGRGQVAPLRIGDTQGVGRYYTISEIGVLLVCTADGNGPDPSASGSANDPRSVSNLAENSFLKNKNDELVDSNYQVTTPDSKDPKFQFNPTLADKHNGTRTAIASGQKRVQAMLLFELTSPMLGYAKLLPDAEVRVTGLNNLRLAGQSPFPSESDGLMPLATGTISTTAMVGGVMGVRFAIALGNNNLRLNGWSNRGNANAYPFVSDPFTITGNTVSIATTNAFTIEILLKQSDNSPSQVVQTFSVKFPSTTMPAPDLLHFGVPWKVDGDGNTFANIASDWWGFDKRIPWASEATRVNFGSADEAGAIIRADVIPTRAASQDWQLNTSNIIVNGNTAEPNTVSTTRTDVVRTILPKAGDYRITTAREAVDADPDASNPIFQKHPLYDTATARFAHTFTEVRDSTRYTGVDISQSTLVPGANIRQRDRPDVPRNVSAFSWTGDWDSGLPLFADGAYTNKPDEGNIYYLKTDLSKTPYYSSDNELSADEAFFTPNRIMPSAVMFGSLPSSVLAGVPWRTLLFRPHSTHPATTSGPRDHLFLDLFNMPVVEPYAISEPFSTAGKINMNYQIVPFTYITRNTGMRAVLAGERIAEVSASDQLYKTGVNNIGPTRMPLNLSDTDGTLRQFKERFDAGDIFRSASEICDIYLVPEGRSWTSNSQANSTWYGSDFALVGDNVRERPYANIYPRLTTKSNSFTVYYTVQALKNPVASNPSQWDENRGAILGQYRGSTSIERYLDPGNASLPDHATNLSADSLDGYYRWRILNSRQFAP